MSPRRSRRVSPPVPPPPARRLWPMLLALAALTVATYSPVWRFGFVASDDPQYVTDNPHVAGGLTAGAVAWAFTAGHEANWHPLTWLSHQLDVSLFGVDAGAHHLINLLLHVANTLLLLVVLRRLTGTYWRSALAAAVFAVHPLHVESVAWIAERKDVLSALFFLLAVGAWERYVRAPGRARYGAVVLLFALGLMAKPMILTLPFVLLLLDYWPLARGVAFRRLAIEKLPLFALAAISAVVTFVAQNRGGAVRSLEIFPFPLRAANALVSVVDYMRDAIWPAALGAFYPFPAALPAGRVAIAALVLLAITAGAIVLRRRAPYLMTGWLWWLGMLVPVAGLVQVGAQARADRYTYLPLIGLSVAVIWGVAALTARWRQMAAGAVLAIIAVGGLAITAHAQVAYWRDAVSIATRTAEVTEYTNNFGVHFGLAEYLRAHGRFAEAIAQYEASIRHQPTYFASHVGLGYARLSAGDTAGATSAFLAALQLAPGDAALHSAVGLLLAQRERFAEAIPHFQEVVRQQPQRAEAHRDLAAALATEGRFADAAPEFEAAIRGGIATAEIHFQLAVVYAALNRTADSVRELKEVLRIDPSHAQARAALAGR